MSKQPLVDRRGKMGERPIAITDRAKDVVQYILANAAWLEKHPAAIHIIHNYAILLEQLDSYDAADAIIADVTDRRGWRQEWEQFDDDIKDEIRESLRRIIKHALMNTSKDLDSTTA